MVPSSFVSSTITSRITDQSVTIPRCCWTPRRDNLLTRSSNRSSTNGSSTYSWCSTGYIIGCGAPGRLGVGGVGVVVGGDTVGTIRDHRFGANVVIIMLVAFFHAACASKAIFVRSERPCTSATGSSPPSSKTSTLSTAASRRSFSFCRSTTINTVTRASDTQNPTTTRSRSFMAKRRCGVSMTAPWSAINGG